MKVNKAGAKPVCCTDSERFESSFYGLPREFRVFLCRDCLFVVCSASAATIEDFFSSFKATNYARFKSTKSRGKLASSSLFTNEIH
jgi:hypothetical protein